MKVIFLDVDGVLNTTADNRREVEYTDPEKVSLLSKIVDATGAKIVVSSSWRNNSNLLNKLTERLLVVGIEIIGKTCSIADHDTIFRYHEIEKWVVDNNPSRYAILDDFVSACCPDERSNMFLTSRDHGLDDKICQQVISHLNQL